jgi:hypothetical protein
MGLPIPNRKLYFFGQKLPATPVKIPVIRASENKKGSRTKKEVCFIREK